MSSATRPDSPTTPAPDEDPWVKSVSEAMASALRHTQAVIEFDVAGMIVRANQIYLDVFGYSAAELEGKHRSVLFESATASDPVWTRLMAGEFVSTRVKRVAKDKRVVWLRADYTPVLDPHGRVLKIVKFAHDITSHQRRGVESRAQLEAINTIRARAEFALDGTVLDVNERFCEILRLPREELVGKQYGTFVENAESHEEFWRALLAGESQSGIYRLHRKDGTTLWLDAFYAPVKDDDGTVLQVIAFASDVTELETQRANVEALTTAIDRSQARVSLTPEGSILDANDNYLHIMGYDGNEIVGKDHRTLVSDEFGASPEYAEFWNQLRSGTPVTTLVERRRKDGKMIHLQATYSPVFDEPDTVTRVLKLASDVTDRVEADRKLRQQVDELLLAAGDAANGDLTVDVTVSGPTPGGRIGEAFKSLIGSMRTNVSAISNSAGIVTFAAEELAKTSSKIAGNAKETRYDAQSVASAAEALTRGITALESTTEELRENIEAISGSAKQASSAAMNAGQVVSNASEVVAKLGESGDGIGKLVTTITWIAEQTDMLALNASIEAARAGHAGRGFAVVAQEVKQLAKQTAGAAGQIRGMVEELQRTAGAAVSSVTEVGSAIERINMLQSAVSEAVEQQKAMSTTLKGTISHAAEDSDGIFGEVKKVVDLATDTSDGVMKIRTAAKDLSATASTMTELVEKFKV